MQINTLSRLGGAALMLSGTFYICDTVADWLSPGNTFGIGIGVSCFALLGMASLYAFALRAQGLVGILAYVLTSIGLTGLAGISLFNNLFRPLLEPETIGMLLSGPGLIYFIATGVFFLVGGVLLAVSVWQTPFLPRSTAIIYLIGCIPVSLPPVFPSIATELGGLAISIALIAWGLVLARTSHTVLEATSA
jgi:hypothetical protein